MAEQNTWCRTTKVEPIATDTDRHSWPLYRVDMWVAVCSEIPFTQCTSYSHTPYRTTWKSAFHKAGAIGPMVFLRSKTLLSTVSWVLLIPQTCTHTHYTTTAVKNAPRKVYATLRYSAPIVELMKVKLLRKIFKVSKCEVKSQCERKGGFWSS